MKTELSKDTCRYLILFVLSMYVSIVFGQGYKYGTNTKHTSITNLSRAINDVDSIYDRWSMLSNPCNDYNEAKESLSSYNSKLHSSVKPKLQRYYYDKFYDACESANLEQAVDFAFKYIMVDGNNDEEAIWKFLVEYYGSDGDTDNTVFLLDCFSNISNSKRNVYATTIESLIIKYDDVIHPISFDEVVTGYWISLQRESYFSDMLTPDYVFNITDLHKENGGQMLKAPTKLWDAKKSDKRWTIKWDTKGFMLLRSQALFCDVDKRYLRFVFASERMRDGQVGLTHRLLESNRQREAMTSGEINSSDASIGEKIAVESINKGVSSLMESFAMSLAVSTKRAEGYEVEFNAISPKVMTSSISYKKVEIKSTGRTRTLGNRPDQLYTFVKWEPEDSTIFIDKNGKPIFINSLDERSPLLDEYREIKKKINFWKPKYSVPVIIGTGAGAYCLYRGIKLTIDDNKENGGNVGRKGKQGLLWMVGGSAVIGCVIGLIIPKIKKDRLAAYDEINRRSMRKMRQKAAEFSLQPNYNPINNAVGIDLCYTF